MVFDVYSRHIVGWSMETHLRTERILAALNMAFTQRQPAALFTIRIALSTETGQLQITRCWPPWLSVHSKSVLVALLHFRP